MISGISSEVDSIAATTYFHFISGITLLMHIRRLHLALYMSNKFTLSLLRIFVAFDVASSLVAHITSIVPYIHLLPTKVTLSITVPKQSFISSSEIILI